MESKKQQKREAFQDAWRTKRSVTLVYILLRASVILVMLAQIFNRNFENVFLCVLTLFLFMVPSMLERKLDIALPNTLEIIILLFIYAAEIMGEIVTFLKVLYPVNLLKRVLCMETTSPLMIFLCLWQMPIKCLI